MIVLSIDNMETQMQMKFNIEKILTRSPRLETVIMVQEFIKEHSAEYKKTELFNNLPKKMMWGTFNVILEYLYKDNKICMDKNGVIVWIYNPHAYKQFIVKKGY
jgi:hypothetical protein